jgi:uncharacterized protein YjbJ (UPF0337 family)
MSATTDKTKGAVKQKVGEMTRDRDLANEGRMDLIKGDLQEMAQKGIDLIEHALGNKKTP